MRRFSEGGWFVFFSWMSEAEGVSPVNDVVFLVGQERACDLGLVAVTVRGGWYRAEVRGLH